MPRCRFVKPEVERLALSDGDWVEVKKRLTVGEARAISLGNVTGLTRDEGGKLTYGVDAIRMGFARLATFLVDWSFRDAQDRPTKPTLETIMALEPETVTEIDAAIDAYLERREMEKNGMTTGSPASGPTSASVNG